MDSIGISGNEQVDKAAGSALRMVSEKTFKISYTDFKINKYILQQRQHCWSNNNYNKLLETKPILGEWKQSFRKSWKEVILSRLHIGHTRIIHSYLLKEEEQPICHAYQTASYTINIFSLNALIWPLQAKDFTTQERTI